jgi:hypothetical protein
MTEEVLGKSHDASVYDDGETAAGVTVTPGMGIERVGTTTDGGPIVQPVSSIEPADAQSRWAREQRDPPRGGPGRMIDMEYQGGEYIEFYTFRSGDEVENAFVASGTDLTNDAGVGGGTTAGSAQATVTVGDSLAFYSDGSLKVAQDPSAAVAEATEAVDNSGAAAGERARISVEVL